jgi:hypothetical protein
VSTFISRGDAPWRAGATLTVVALVLAGCGASVTSPPATSPTPSLAGTVTQSPAASATPLSSSLQGSWVGPTRVISQLGSTSVLPVLEIDGRNIWVRLDLAADLSLVSSATISGPGTLALTLNAASAGCAAGAAGTYAWSLAPGGAALTLTATTDPCAARATAFSGTWTRSVCRNSQDLCLGAVPAGTYVSTFFDIRDASADIPNRGAYGQLRYTLPAGWANGDDFPDDYNLMPAADYAGAAGVTDGSAYHGIYLFARPAPQADTASCADALAPGIGQTPDALAAWVAGRPGVVATTPTPLTVGGDPGMMVDVHLAPSRTKMCPGDTFPSQPLLIGWGVRPGELQRYIFLDVGGGRTVAIFIDDTSTPSRFTDLVAQAMPIIATFQFPTSQAP